MLRRRDRQRASSQLAFEHVALSDRGPTLTLAVPAGSLVAIVGPAASGKSKLLGVVTGQERPIRGEVTRPSGILSLEEMTFVRRDKPSSIAKRCLGDQNRTRIADALSALGLWEDRNRAIANLGAGQQVAARFIEPLINAPDLLASDGDLDLLDPWMRDRLWPLLQDRRSEGMTFVFTTNSAELAEMADLVVVLKDQQVVFSDSPQALVRSLSSSAVTVETNDHPGALALTNPFEVAVTETSAGIRFEAAEGQQLAAKLLSEGYGDVRYVVVRHPTFREALGRLLG